MTGILIFWEHFWSFDFLLLSFSFFALSFHENVQTTSKKLVFKSSNHAVGAVFSKSDYQPSLQHTYAMLPFALMVLQTKALYVYDNFYLMIALQR